MADLPQGYQVLSLSFDSIPEQLQTTVQAIHDQLKQNNWQGNQWLVIGGLSQAAIDRLTSIPDCLLGIAFRFMWNGTAGLIKVVSSIPHILITSSLHHYIDRQCTRGGQFSNWPSLVIETGVSESFPKQCREATWWFQNSSGDTRIVIVISIRTVAKEVRFEKWQLLPPNVSRQAIGQLRRQPDQMPPLVQQQANDQTAFSVQEVLVTPTSVTGGPLVIPFKAHV